jgi:hypothetical protein
MLVGTALAKEYRWKESGEEETNQMKIHTLFFGALFLTGTGLWTRIAVQGLELGLLSAAIEWFINRVRQV